MVKLIGFLGLLLLQVSLFGQRFQQYTPSTISLQSKIGLLIAHRASMAHLPDKSPYAFELELSQQDASNSAWSSIYKHPMRGVSIGYQDFGNDAVLGQGYSASVHTAFPIIQDDRFGFFDFRLNTGVGWVNRKYDAQENPKNNAIGSNLNGYVNLMFRWQKYFKHWNIGGGIEFTHFSNASMKPPNLGLNVPSFFIQTGYNIHQRSAFKESHERGEPSNYEERMADEIYMVLNGGLKQNVAAFSDPVFRPIIGLQGLYSKRIGVRWKLDLGMDFTYNDANRHFEDTSVYSVSETFQLGFYAGASLQFYKVEFLVGVGVYAINQINPWGYVYDRLGFRYHFTDKLLGGVAIKAHYAIADFLEFSVGYRLWKNKSGFERRDVHE